MLECPPRFATARNFDRDTIGPEIAQTMSDLGYTPMPWQRDVLDVSGELDPDGTLHYGEARVTVPRQSGKSSVLLALHVDRMLRATHRWGDKRPLTIHEAQTAAAAREMLTREWEPIVSTSDLRGQLTKFVRSNGKESLEFGPGRIITAPPTMTGAHGLARVALVSLDESFSHVDDRAEQGARPTMIVHPSPQLWITSTAGTTDSTYLWSKVEDGRARTHSGESGSVCYFEWSASDDDDPGDPKVWQSCSPALGHTITERTIRQAYESMDVDAFRRSFLNVWTASQSRIIPAAAWHKCEDPTSTISGRCWFAVDASPDRVASISVSGRNMAGQVHVEVVDSKPGLDWVVDAMHKITRLHPTDGVILDPRGPIGSIAPDIERACNTKVTYADGSLMANAAGRFLSDVLEGNLRHLGQEELDAAVAGASKRQMLDAWAWARRSSQSNISPLVGVTLASWKIATAPAFSMPGSF